MGFKFRTDNTEDTSLLFKILKDSNGTLYSVVCENANFIEIRECDIEGTLVPNRSRVRVQKIFTVGHKNMQDFTFI